MGPRRWLTDWLEGRLLSLVITMSLSLILSHTGNWGPNICLYQKKFWLSMGRCSLKTCHNWCKWDKRHPHPRIRPSHPPTHPSFLCLWDGVPPTCTPHPPWSLHTGPRPFKRRPLKLWSSTWVQKNIFLPYTVPRKPKFLCCFFFFVSPLYTYIAKLTILSNKLDILTKPNGSPSVSGLCMAQTVDKVKMPFQWQSFVSGRLFGAKTLFCKNRKQPAGGAP